MKILRLWLLALRSFHPNIFWIQPSACSTRWDRSSATMPCRPAIQWASVWIPSGEKSWCKSGWQWDISRMTMSRRRDMSKIYNRRNEGKRQNSNFNVSISIRMTMSCRMSVLQPGQNREAVGFHFPSDIGRCYVQTFKSHSRRCFASKNTAGFAAERSLKSKC